MCVIWFSVGSKYTQSSQLRCPFNWQQLSNLFDSISVFFAIHKISHRCSHTTTNETICLCKNRSTRYSTGYSVGQKIIAVTFWSQFIWFRSNKFKHHMWSTLRCTVLLFVCTKMSMTKNSKKKQCLLNTSLGVHWMGGNMNWFW